MCQHIWVGCASSHDTFLRCLRCRGHTTLQAVYDAHPSGPEAAIMDQQDRLMDDYLRLSDSGAWEGQC